MVAFNQMTNQQKQDYFLDTLVNRIINFAQINVATNTQWEHPFIPETNPSGTPLGTPISAASGNTYNGRNVLTLQAAARFNVRALKTNNPQTTRKFEDPRWITYHNAKKNGGYVKSGEMGVPVMGIEEKEVVVKDKFDNPILDENGNEVKEKKKIIVKNVVFNIEQCAGFPPESEFSRPWQPELPPKPFELNAMAEEYLQALGSVAVIGRGGKNPNFDPATDMVSIPFTNYFKTQYDYYHTIFHELTHWTKGAPGIIGSDRLHRGLKGIGPEGRAREEFIADLGSYLFTRELNIQADNNRDWDQLTSYLNSWMRAIPNFYDDKTKSYNWNIARIELKSAISDAYEAYDYLKDIIKNYQQTHKDEIKVLPDRIYLNVQDDKELEIVVKMLANVDPSDPQRRPFITYNHDVTQFKQYIPNYDEVLKKFNEMYGAGVQLESDLNRTIQDDQEKKQPQDHNFDRDITALRRIYEMRGDFLKFPANQGEGNEYQEVDFDTFAKINSVLPPIPQTDDQSEVQGFLSWEGNPQANRYEMIRDIALDPDAMKVVSQGMMPTLVQLDSTHDITINSEDHKVLSWEKVISDAGIADPCPKRKFRTLKRTEELLDAADKYFLKQNQNDSCEIHGALIHFNPKIQDHKDLPIIVRGNIQVPYSTNDLNENFLQQFTRLAKYYDFSPEVIEDLKQFGMFSDASKDNSMKDSEPSHDPRPESTVSITSGINKVPEVEQPAQQPEQYESKEQNQEQKTQTETSSPSSTSTTSAIDPQKLMENFQKRMEEEFQKRMQQMQSDMKKQMESEIRKVQEERDRETAAAKTREHELNERIRQLEGDLQKGETSQETEHLKPETGDEVTAHEQDNSPAVFAERPGDRRNIPDHEDEQSLARHARRILGDMLQDGIKPDDRSLQVLKDYLADNLVITSLGRDYGQIYIYYEAKDGLIYKDPSDDVVVAGTPESLHKALTHDFVRELISQSALDGLVTPKLENRAQLESVFAEITPELIKRFELSHEPHQAQSTESDEEILSPDVGQEAAPSHHDREPDAPDIRAWLQGKADKLRETPAGEIKNDPLAYATEDFDVGLSSFSPPLRDEQELDNLPGMSFVRLADGSVRYHTQGSHFWSVEGAPEEVRNALSEIVAIRDTGNELLQVESGQLSAQEGRDPETLRKELNRQYNSFVRNHGYLRRYRQQYQDDASCDFLNSMEVFVPLDKGQASKHEKDAGGRFIDRGEIFKERIVRMEPDAAPENAEEALSSSLSRYGKVDLKYMAQSMKLSREDIPSLISSLQGQIFLDPQKLPSGLPVNQMSVEDTIDAYVTREEYLSGNIPERMEAASKAGLDENVRELKGVLPSPVPAENISIQLGASWIPKEIYQQFVDHELLMNESGQLGRVRVVYSAETEKLSCEYSGTTRNRLSALGSPAIRGYGTPDCNAVRLLECAFRHTSPSSSEACKKLDEMQVKFRRWLLKDEKRKEIIEGIYNAKFNSVRPREYDGSHLQLPGSSRNIELRSHQLNAIARITSGGNTLLAHGVGAGKTFEMIAGAMECKRLGKCHKSLLCVPGHIVGQVAADFRVLYPSAKLMVWDPDDKGFLTKLARTDCDAVIISHNQLKNLPVSERTMVASCVKELQRLDQELTHVRETVAAERRVPRSKVSFEETEIQKRIIQVTAEFKKHQKKLEKEKLDPSGKTLAFEDTGVDKIFIDEAHLFKNLKTETSLGGIPGISTEGAKKTDDLLCKCRYLDEATGSNGVVFATGTPVSNSMTELYTMMRYLEPERLREMGISRFDSWATTFGEIKSESRLMPVSNEMKVQRSMANFTNTKQLLDLFHQCADVILSDDVARDLPGVKYETVMAEPSEFQKNYMSGLLLRAKAVEEGRVRREDDNMLRITHAGRALGLDERTVGGEDHESSKTNLCVQKVLEIYRSTEAQKSTQLIFCDQCVPKAVKPGRGSKDEDAELERDVETDPAITFDIYADIKDKLLKSGVKESEIAFIHDAKDQEQKKALFEKMQSGQIRILIGSTAKMGAGTNIQQKLCALHHLDIGWKPSDIEQREGRIIRHGNENREVKIFNYITKGTMDAYLWQKQENKQRFIKQVMVSKNPVNAISDVDETELKFAEIKALAMGDESRISERLRLEVELKRLQLRKLEHESEEMKLANELKSLPRQISTLENKAEILRRDAAFTEQYPSSDLFQGISLNGSEVYNRADAEKKIHGLMKEFDSLGVDSWIVGRYKGFHLSLEKRSEPARQDEFVFRLTSGSGNSYVTRPLSAGDTASNIRKLDERLDGIADSLNKVTNDIRELREHQEDVQGKLGRPFSEEQHMAELRQQIEQLNQELGMESSADQQTQELPDEENEEVHDRQFDMFVDRDAEEVCQEAAESPELGQSAGEEHEIPHHEGQEVQAETERRKLTLENQPVRRSVHRR